MMDLVEKSTSSSDEVANSRTLPASSAERSDRVSSDCVSSIPVCWTPSLVSTVTVR